MITLESEIMDDIVGYIYIYGTLIPNIAGNWILNSGM